MQGNITLDARLGKTPRWYLDRAPSGINMRTPDEVLKCALFLGHFEGGDLHLGGTAFVVSLKERWGSSYPYLVTARHAIIAIGNREQGIRANLRDGGADDIRIEGESKWWFHPTEEKSVDVAVRPFVADEFDIIAIPTSMFLGDSDIQEYYVGQGDEVVIPGLFTQLIGRSKNVPIIRRGSVAMFPDEPIPSVDMGDSIQDIDGYLVEVRSVGGLSGSPAFVRAPIGMDYKVHGTSGDYRVATAHLQGDYFFLGLMQGHWEIPPHKRNKVDFPSAKKGEDSINLGIAIVVPAKKILEVLQHPDLAAMREEARKQEMEARGTTTLD